MAKTYQPAASRLIIVHWDDADAKHLRPAGEYLARIDDDNNAYILRTIQPGELAQELDRLRAYNERHFTTPPEQTIAQARAQAALQRQQPLEGTIWQPSNSTSQSKPAALPVAGQKESGT